MNKHIIVEEHPHALRHVVLSVGFAWIVFFTLGVFGRPILEEAWNRITGVNSAASQQKNCAPDQTVTTPKPTLRWSIDAPLKSSKE